MAEENGQTPIDVMPDVLEGSLYFVSLFKSGVEGKAVRINKSVECMNDSQRLYTLKEPVRDHLLSTLPTNWLDVPQNGGKANVRVCLRSSVIGISYRPWKGRKDISVRQSWQ